MSGSLTDESQLPIEIDDCETIVRAVVADAHFDRKKCKLKPAVFRPRSGNSSISVMRQLMGDDFCKSKGVEIGAAASNQTYVGLLTIKASSIRSIGSTITDSRSEWLGHADLDHGFPSPPPNDPGSAIELQRMTERCQAFKRSEYVSYRSKSKRTWMEWSFAKA